MKSIVTRKLCKDFKSVRAVGDLDLEIGEGELFALLGSNGAGKSTTIKMLTCLIRPTSGEAFVMGKNVVDRAHEVKGLIGVSPQETAVAPLLTVRENLDFIGGIYGLDKCLAVEKRNTLIGQFALAGVADRQAKILSGGFQRRLSIAMALVSEPKVLFLDEPTLGLDVLARRDLWQAIRSLKGKTTVVLTTHYLEEAEALSDRVGIMADGRLRAVGRCAEISAKAGKASFEEAFVSVVTGGSEL